MATMAEKQLGQSRPANTNATSIYAPPASTIGIVTRVEIQNTTSNNETFSLFHDADGTTYDETTALFYLSPIAASAHVTVDCHWAGDDSSGHFAVRTSTGSALTFTFYGVELT